MNFIIKSIATFSMVALSICGYATTDTVIGTATESSSNSADTLVNQQSKQELIRVYPRSNKEIRQSRDGFVKRMLPKSEYRRVSKPTVFVPKGQWILGATVQYSENSLKDIKFLILDEVTTSGYNVKTNAFVGYALFNDGVLGLKAGYHRTLIDLGSTNIKLNDDLNFNIKDNYFINHSFSGTVFLRNYISLFNSLRFGLFNDVELTYEMGQGKALSGSGESFKGTYNDSKKISIGLSPGGTVFISDFAAIEIAIGVLGFQSTWVKQTTNQVDEGTLRRSSANFKIDLFSIKLGVTFYLNSKKLGDTKTKSLI